MNSNLAPTISRFGDACRGIHKTRAECETHSWRRGLPKDWQDQVMAPLCFEIQRDYEVAAARVIGTDEDDVPCYCDYRCTLTDLCCDVGEVFYAVPSYAEELSAWRLRDGRWLIRRIVITRDNADVVRAFYCLGEQMPR